MDRLNTLDAIGLWKQGLNAHFLLSSKQHIGLMSHCFLERLYPRRFPILMRPQAFKLQPIVNSGAMGRVG